MTLILGISGKKSSGKNTCFNWLVGQHLVSLGLTDWTKINELGQLVVPCFNEAGEVVDGVLDVDNPEAAPYLNQNVWPTIKNYSYATPLKEFCMNVFGLSYAQCYGSNDDKDTVSTLKWEDMPYRSDIMMDGLYVNEMSGYMSGRQVLQYFGTNICRQMLGNCWVDATIRKIKQEGSMLAVITDVRFENEVRGIQEAGGKVLRFTRATFAGQDEHESETALDNYVGFDYIIDNSNMSIPQQNEAVTKLLQSWSYL